MLVSQGRAWSDPREKARSWALRFSFEGGGASKELSAALVTGDSDTFRWLLVEHERTLPVGLPSLVALNAHAGSSGGCGLSQRLPHMTSANSACGTANSDGRKGCFGSNPVVSDGRENVGFREQSGSRFRAAGCLLVATGRNRSRGSLWRRAARLDW